MKFKQITDSRPVRMVFLGCGMVTEKHSKTLKGLAPIDLYYASRSPEKANAYNRKFQGAGIFDSYELAIASQFIDVVFIATPPDSHFDLAKKSIMAGKHVIVEKPPFLRSADFEEIMQLQRESGLQIMVAENYFYKPLLKRVREALQSGVIGEPKFLHFNATKTQGTKGWRNSAANAGGGALFEGGIHWVNFVSNLGLEVESVNGYLPGKRLIEGNLERSMLLVFKYVDGPVGTLLYSWEINNLLKVLCLSKIYGTQGSITFESNGIFVFIRGKSWSLIFPGFSDMTGSKAMLEDFIWALQSGEEPKFNLQLAKRDLVLIETAYKSSGI